MKENYEIFTSVFISPQILIVLSRILRRQVKRGYNLQTIKMMFTALQKLLRPPFQYRYTW